MIALGACLVEDPEVSFYREIQPLLGMPWDREAERIHRLTPEHLQQHGVEPPLVMAGLARWLEEVAPGRQPIFVGFNAAFDWMFVADYFHRFLGRNPFGISALDLKALYMGRHGVERWDATRYSEIVRMYPTRRQMTHQALDDARAQAELADVLLKARPGVSPPRPPRPGC